MKIGIIGLGLIGGSMGLALKKSGYAARVLGYDANADHSQWALENEIIGVQCGTIEELKVFFQR